MIISNAWLKEYLPHNLKEADVAKKLTLAGFEVVDMRRVNQIPAGLVVGEVLTKKRHPEADRLNLVEIAYINNDARLVAEVICGADNIDAGQKIVFAPVGTNLGDGFVIKKAKIRGIYSSGMVCSKAEVGQEEKSDGIWVLPEEATLESNLHAYFGNEDTLFDIDLTSNRPDCQSVVGIANELRAMMLCNFFGEEVTKEHAHSLKKDFFEKGLDFISPSSVTTKYNPKKLFSGLAEHGTLPVEKLPFDVEVEAAEEDVPVYLVRVISGIAPLESPLWLQQKLIQHGLRPLNVVVDVTNLMMLEYGQPMHAFDADVIPKRKIIVRNAREGETLSHLMNSTAKCVESDVVIASVEKPIAFAGVIGGKATAVGEGTTEIVLEAAVFGKKATAATVKQHGLATDASTYFQRFVCGDRTTFALDKAAQLLVELAVKKGKRPIVGEIVGRFPAAINVNKPRNGIFTPQEITLAHSHVQRVLGKNILAEEVAMLLTSLNFSVKYSAKKENSSEITYVVVPPPFRQDVNYAWDVVEEVVRMYGYNNVPMEVAPIRHGNYSIAQHDEQKALNLAMGLGFQEVMTYPFIETELIDEVFSNTTGLIEVQNPMQKNYAYLRNSLLYGMLRTLRLNVERGRASSFRLTECGHVFFPSPDPREKKKYQEKAVIGFLLAAPTEKESKEGISKNGFLLAKGAVESFVNAWTPAIDIPSIEAKPAHFLYSYHFSAANLFSYGECIASVARVNDEFINFFHLKRMAVFYAEVDLKAMAAFAEKPFKYRRISNYPSVYRDIALVVKKNTQLGSLVSDIAAALPLVRRATLMEIYTGKGIAEDEKSFVFNVELRSKDKTLQSEEADALVLKIIEALKGKHSFRLR